MKPSTSAAAVAALTALAVLAGAGCESLPRKFIRKPKAPKHVPAVIYTEEGEYQKKFSNEYYYKTHYTMWKTWHSEIGKQLGGNSKRLERSAQEALSHLEQMAVYLDEPTRAELDEHVQALGRIVKRIEASGYSKSADASVRTELDKIERIVGQRFQFSEVKDHILQQTVELGGEGTGAPQTAP